MKIENNLENKSKFFAIYFGQYIGYTPLLGNDKKYVQGNFLILSGVGQSSYIKLKPLESISDEELRDIAEIHIGKKSEVFIDKSKDNSFISVQYSKQNSENPNYDFISMELWLTTDDCEISNNWNYHNKRGISNSKENIRNILHIYDFLRSKGYAIPFMDLTIQDLIDYGWIKLVK